MDHDSEGPRPGEGEQESPKEEPRERVLDLEADEDAPTPTEITLERNEALKDLRDLQELSVERASGRGSGGDEERH